MNRATSVVQELINAIHTYDESNMVDLATANGLLLHIGVSLTSIMLEYSVPATICGLRTMIYVPALCRRDAEEIAKERLSEFDVVFDVDVWGEPL